MRVSRHLVSLVAVAVPLLTGCQSLEKGHPSTTPALLQFDLSDEQVRFANVLSHYGMGVIHETHREMEQAINEYLQAARLDPDNEELHFRIARGLIRLKRNQEAIDLIHDLAARRPKSSQAQIWLALAYQANSQPDRAKEVYQMLVAQNVEDYIPYIDLASIYLQEGNEQAAEETLIKGTEQAGERLELFKILGRYYTEALSRNKDKGVDEKRLQKAIRVFEQAAKISPDELGILNSLGSLHLMEGDLERAMRRFREMEQLHPNSLQVKQSIALQIVEATGDLDQAIETLRTYLDKHEDEASVHYYLGELYQQDDKAEQAFAAFSVAAEKSENDPVPYIRLSLLTLESDPGEAVRVLQTGLDKMPDEEKLTEMLAYAHLANEDTEEALSWFQKVDATKPREQQTGSFHFNYALAEYRSGNHANAASRLNEAMHHNLSYLERFVAQMLSDRDVDLKAPIALLRQVSKRYDDEPTVFRFLAFLYSYDQQFEESVKTCELALKLAEDSVRKEILLDAQFFFIYAAALERTGAFESAAEYFLKVVELSPDHSNAHNYLAYMWAERGEHLNKALKHVQTALTIEPDSPAFIDTLGWIYFQQGKYEDALAEIQKAADILQDDPTIVEHLGDVYDKLGQPDRAMTQWQRAFIMDAGNTKMREKLEALEVDMEPLLEKAEAWKKKMEAETKEKEPGTTEKVALEPDMEPTGPGSSEENVITNEDILPHHFYPEAEVESEPPEPIIEQDVVPDAPVEGDNGEKEEATHSLPDKITTTEPPVLQPNTNKLDDLPATPAPP